MAEYYQTDKMKQAILLTAYKDIEQLKILIDLFNDDFSFYIHIDNNSQITEKEIGYIQKLKKVNFIAKKYATNWGGINHTKSILLLAREIIKDDKIEYIHFISSQDYPVKTCKEITDILTKNRGSEFLGYFKLPGKYWSSENGGLDRIDYFNFYEWFNVKTKVGKKIALTLVRIQKKLHMKRSRKYLPQLYGGSNWWTLSYPCLKYIIDYTDSHPKFFNRFRYTAVACEIYFHTIIMNSPFKDNVIDSDLRYIIWNTKDGIALESPRVLDENDYNNIVNSDAIFARKIEYPASKKLINKINKYLFDMKR
jgi:hypothetical protein